MTEAVDAMLNTARGFTEAAAGCGKTQLLGQIVQDERSGRQLVLTHTHAGVAAIKHRLTTLGVPASKYRLDTIAGWCLRYGASYPAISGLAADSAATPDWDSAYPGAERVARSQLGQRVLLASYNGVLVDEYQDCSLGQHAVVNAVGLVLPCRGVGDFLQSVFAFRDDPCVTKKTIEKDFDLLKPLLHPWRWKRPDCNRELGQWLVAARRELQEKGTLTIATDAPVNWVQHKGSSQDQGSWAKACQIAGAVGESQVAIVRWPNRCIQLAKRLSGRWPVIERFDDPDLFDCALRLSIASGPEAVGAIYDFLKQRMTGMGTDLRRIVSALREGRPTGRFSTHLEELELLSRLAEDPTPKSALAAIEGLLGHRKWWLYRRECVYQLRTALQECLGGPLADLPDAAAAARTRARHRGRRLHHQTIGTPLLVKGLEFDHAVVLWEPDHLTIEGLYVAITRASKSLTIVSKTRVLHVAKR